MSRVFVAEDGASPLIDEARTLPGARHGAALVAAEETVAKPGDQVVRGIAHEPRYDCEYSGKLPGSAEIARDAERRRGTCE